MTPRAKTTIAALTSPALDAIEHAINQRDNLLVSFKASADVLDRNAIGAEVESRIKAPVAGEPARFVLVSSRALSRPSR